MPWRSAPDATPTPSPDTFFYSQVVRTFLAGFLIPFGIFIMLRSARQLWRFRRAVRWPHVWGVIESAQVEGDESDTCFRPAVEYRYEVGGQSFLARHIAPGLREVYETREAAEEGLAEYYVGLRKLVFYDPTTPGVSLLEPYESRNIWAGLLLGLGALEAGLYILLW